MSDQYIQYTSIVVVEVKGDDYAPLLRSTAGNIFSMYLANIFFGEFRAGNLNAKFNINSYIRNKEGWLK